MRFPHTRISNVALLCAVCFAALALQRFRTYHNETFDLAFYARLVWGLGHGDQYQPLTNSYFWGLHASPVLFVLGQFGRVFPIVPMLLVAQAAALSAAAIPLARIAARRIGHPFAADLTLVVYMLYPTVATAATYEFHPSSLAVLPLAMALEYFDRGVIGRGGLALLAAAMCREDAALTAGLCGLALAVDRDRRRAGLFYFGAGVLWFGIYMFVIAPRMLPRHGSLALHFGQFGGRPATIALHVLSHPLSTAGVVFTGPKLLYLVRLLVPVAFLSLLAPRWLLPALAPVAINLLSSFPTAAQIQSHYSLLVTPFVITAAADGAARLGGRHLGTLSRNLAIAGVAAISGTLLMQHRAGATPLSRRWHASDFEEDERAPDLDALLRLVPEDDGVVAPDEVLAHVATRPTVQRLAQWTRSLEDVIVSIEYRGRFGATQNLWRSTEETVVRNTLASDKYGLYAAEGTHLLFRKGWPARAFARGRYAEWAPGTSVRPFLREIGPSLTMTGWDVQRAFGGSVVTIVLIARQPLPADLGFELGYGTLHPVGDRLDPAAIVSVLPFAGLFSPVHVRVGESVRDRIFIPIGVDELAHTALYFGARRLDGSRLDPQAPHWILLR